MVDWHRFIPSDFEYDFERDKLAAHRITFGEAVECFFSAFEVRRNKSFHDRYQLVGRTVGGRQLKIIFQLTANCTWVCTKNDALASMSINTDSANASANRFKNRACEFPRTRLKPLKRSLKKTR